jgi:hypothetical protein
MYLAFCDGCTFYDCISRCPTSCRRRTCCPEDPHFDFEYETLFSLFIVRALTDFSKTATRRTNDNLSLRHSFELLNVRPLFHSRSSIFSQLEFSEWRPSIPQRESVFRSFRPWPVKAHFLETRSRNRKWLPPGFDKCYQNSIYRFIRDVQPTP